MNAVLIAVLVMLILSVARVHVVISLFIGALVGGLISGIGLGPTMVAFQDGLAGGAKIALSYALLGAFAMAVASSGLPTLLARWIMSKIGNTEESANRRAVLVTKWLMVAGVLAMAIMSQNLIPVHIAFIPLIIPPLLGVMNKLRIDRRLIACVLTFGLVTTYMWIPVGFGSIFLNEILLGNIRKAGLDTTGINIMQVMSIPALGMIAGLIIAVGFSYRKPRDYENRPLEAAHSVEEVTRYKVIVAIIAILATFIVQVVMQLADSEAGSLLIGALTGLAVFLVTGAVNWKEADDVFTSGMKMMALIGFIMITAQGFAAVMTATGQVETLVDASAALFGSNKAMGALVMLIVGLIVTMGIGSSFSTLPIIATLGPTAGLNADGQHDHIRDSVIPTFLHYNLPLIVSGWVAAMVL